MHIHGNQMNLTAINPYSAAAERADAAQKAADVRKKLTKGASDVQGASISDEAFMMGTLTSPWHSQTFTQDEYHTADRGRDSDFG